MCYQVVIYDILHENLIISQKIVTPVKTGVQSFSYYPKTLNSGACPGLRSGIRRKDGKEPFHDRGDQFFDHERLRDPA